MLDSTVNRDKTPVFSPVVVKSIRKLEDETKSLDDLIRDDSDL